MGNDDQKPRELELLHDAYFAVDPEYEARTFLDGIDDVQDLCHLHGRLEALLAAAKLAKAALEDRIAGELGPNGAIRVGNRFYRAAPTRRFRVHNPQGLIEFLGADWPQVIPASAARVGSLKNLAEARGLAPQTVVDTFGQYEDSGSPLSVYPIDKAPAYAQRLQDGQRTFPKGRTLESVDKPQDQAARGPSDAPGS